MSSVDAPFRVLFICRHNAARSIMAQGLLRKWGGSRFVVESAGSEPATSLDPIAVDLLARVSVSTDGQAPGSVAPYLADNAQPFDFIFTLDDDVWKGPQPKWPGNPLNARWAFPDPSAVDGTDIERRALFNLVFGMIERRVKIFCALPGHRLKRLTAQDLSDIATQQAAG